MKRIESDNGLFTDRQTELTRSWLRAVQNEIKALVEINGNAANNATALQLETELRAKCQSVFDDTFADLKSNGFQLPGQNSDALINAVLALITDNTLEFSRNFFSSTPTSAEETTFLNSILTQAQNLDRGGVSFVSLASGTYTFDNPITFLESAFDSSSLACWMRWNVLDWGNQIVPPFESATGKTFYGLNSFLPSALKNSSIDSNGVASNAMLITSIYLLSTTGYYDLNFEVYKSGGTVSVHVRRSRNSQRATTPNDPSVQIELFREVAT